MLARNLRLLTGFCQEPKEGGRGQGGGARIENRRFRFPGFMMLCSICGGRAGARKRAGAGIRVVPVREKPWLCTTCARAVDELLEVEVNWIRPGKVTAPSSAESFPD